MSAPDLHRTPYGRERTCPHCGTRVAQKAQACFSCGAALHSAPRRRLGVPWADLFLFAAIASVLALWWLRGQETLDGLQAGTGGPLTPAVDMLMTPAALIALAQEELPPITASPAEAAAEAQVSAEPTALVESTPTPPAGPTRYKVKSGDTVAAIAAQYGSTIKDIIQANNLRADGWLQAGQELIIPVPGAVGGAAPAPTPTPTGGALVYMVRSGDTVSGIASQLGSQSDWILNANQMKPTDILRVGQALLVPLSQDMPTPEPTATALATSTPTPASPGLRAPVLLNPADGSTVSGPSGILLTWGSVGILGQDQWYVVTLQSSASSAPTATWWTKTTSWRLPADLRGEAGAGVEFTWQVQVHAGSSEQPGAPASPASEAHRFTWR